MIRISTVVMVTMTMALTMLGDTWGQGLVLPSVGPVNRSMAGTSVAAPIDAAGSMHWNPASISGLHSSQFLFGTEFIYGTTKVTSSISANSLGPGVPPVQLSATDRSDAGVNVLPTVAWVHQLEESDWTFGLGLFTIGGFGANFPGNDNNPVLSPPPPNGFGVGNVYSSLSLLQLAPTAALQVTEHLSVGIAPTVSVAGLSVSPAFFASPDDANGDGFFGYPAATHARLHWGLGFQVGLYLTTDGPWRFGASYKSPQWFETFEYNAVDEIGRARRIGLDVDYPAIYSLGIAYQANCCTLLAADVRYVDYDNAEGLGDAAQFDAAGALRGFGWDSVFSVATGLQRKCNDRLTLRMGYLFTENPISDDVTAVNVASPTIYQHAIFAGISSHLTAGISLDLSYYHAFQSSIEGPLDTAAGSIPGSSIGIEQRIDALIVGLHMDY